MKKRVLSFKYAWNGIVQGFKLGTNIKIHGIIAFLVLLFGFLLKVSTMEWMIIFICFGMVIGAELFNTSIELIVDKISPEKEKIAGKIKDIAAGAVLICALAAAIVGLLIFVPKIMAFFAI
jgi:diacylglycerol kinase (ATP)